MRIEIDVIPHSAQRYDTPGDWYEQNGTLFIRVSRMADGRSEMAVVVHEVVEALLCADAGIHASEVDAWDFACTDPEPGDNPAAPYHQQHVVATTAERLMTDAMDLDWKAHSACVEGAGQATPGAPGELAGASPPGRAGPLCSICGKPMPAGEAMFRYHGYSGPCPT